MKKKSTLQESVDEKMHNNSCPTPKGKLLVIGGKENKGEAKAESVPAENVVELEILTRFIELTGKEKPVIEVITTATSTPDDVIKDYQKAFHLIGVKQIGHIHHNTRSEIFDEKLIERIRVADGIFLSGGDQLKLTSIYGGSDFLTNLKYRYINKNIVIGGTSAGAMALSTPMIYAGAKDVEQTAGEIKITTGLEFLKDVCIDTHFVHRGRFVRMAQVIVSNPTSIGIGIEEDTAIVVQNGVETEVIGSGTIIIIDGFHISDSNIAEFSEKKAVSMRNLKVHLLGRGDKYTIPQMNPPHK